MLRHDGAVWWVAGLFGVLLHDDGWILVNRRSVVVASGRAPNTGFQRAWWKSKLRGRAWQKKRK